MEGGNLGEVYVSPEVSNSDSEMDYKNALLRHSRELEKELEKRPNLYSFQTIQKIGASRFKIITTIDEDDCVDTSINQCEDDE